MKILLLAFLFLCANISAQDTTNKKNKLVFDVSTSIEVSTGYIFSMDNNTTDNMWLSGEKKNKFVLGQNYINVTAAAIKKNTAIIGSVLLGFDSTQTLLRNVYAGAIISTKNFNYSIYGGLIDNPYYTYNYWSRNLLIETPSDQWGFIDRSDYGLTGSIGYKNFVLSLAAFNGGKSDEKNYMANVIIGFEKFSAILMFSRYNNNVSTYAANFGISQNPFVLNVEGLYNTNKKMVISGSVELTPIKKSKWSLIGRYDFHKQTIDSDDFSDIKIFGILYKPSPLTIGILVKNTTNSIMGLSKSHNELAVFSKVNL